MYRKLLFIAAVMLMLIVPASAWSFSCVGPDMSTPLNDNATVYVGDTIRCWPDDTDMAVYEASSLHAQDKTNLLFSSPFTGTFVNYTIPSRTGYLWFRTLNAAHDAYFVDKFYYYAYYKTPPADVVFSISETGNFTKKLSGAIVTVSNGQSNTTTADGTALIRVYPTSSAYTYGVTKTGYGTLAAQPLGGYGETGGTVYVEMESGTSGNVRTYVQAVDGATGGQVHFSNLQLKDVNQSLWTNVTNDFDGTHFIDTLQSTTINAYADMTGYTSASRLGLTPFNEGMYEIVLWPAGSLLNPGPGNVNLIVLVNDRTTSAPISSASVSAMQPSGAVEGSATGTTGTVTFVVPNMSVIHVTAKKDGYTAGTGTITTTAFGPDTLRIELTKATVTPVVTATPLPGEVTVRPTYIPGCEPPNENSATCQKNMDNSIWAGLRRDAPVLYNLGFLACVVGLLFLAIKTMKLK
jgi:hypothetical protein